jgi:hypothetical protein
MILIDVVVFRVQPDDGLSKGGIVAFMALFALLWFMVPYQFALVVIFIIHLHSTAIAYHRGVSDQSFVRVSLVEIA